MIKRCKSLAVALGPYVQRTIPISITLYAHHNDRYIRR